MTPRRLIVLITCLPAESLTFRLLAAEAKQAVKPAADHIREREAFYRTQAEGGAA